MEGIRRRSQQGGRGATAQPPGVPAGLSPGARGSWLRDRRGRQRQVLVGTLERKVVVCYGKTGGTVKIEAITLREIHMPLVHFFETSFGRTTERRILLVTMHTDGPEGWGECVAGEDPHYSEESVDTAWYAVERYFGPALLGKNIERGADVPAMLSRIRGHRMAKGAMENAVWDAE